MRISTRLVAMAAILVCTLSHAQSPAVRTERDLLAAVNQVAADRTDGPG